ncbi:MAG TPA: Ig-like domain-containing protein [Pyrinomonadaceae bacterium]|jgi:hypothetical protein
MHRRTHIITITLALIFALTSLVGGYPATITLNTARAATNAPLPFTVPVASSFSATVATNRQNAIQLQGSDAEGTALTYATTSTPSHGSLSNLNSSTGVVVYTPTDGYVGADSFTYTVASGGDTSTAGTVTLAVTNAKTRIIDTIDPSMATGATGITFILTQAATSPGGLIPKGSSVSASVNSLGQFDISVYPSRSLTPAAYYQVWLKTSNLGQVLMGVYDIPLSTTTITLSPYKVTDTNLALQYSFASQAAVAGLVGAAATATTNTLLGTNPTNNALQKYNSGTGKFTNSTITDNGTAVTVAANTTVSGSVTTTGAVISENIALPAATKAMIANGQIPYSAEYVKGLVAYFDASTLDLAEGDKVASWPDLSGNARHAVQATGALQPTYHQSETFTESSAPYVTAGGTTQYLTVPIPASATKSFCLVIRNQTQFPTAYALNFDANNWFSTLAPNGSGRWTGYRTSLGGSTTPAGYAQEYSVPCWRMNSASSISVFMDGALVETYTPLDSALAAATSIKIGPGFGYLRQLAILDYGRAMTDAEVASHSTMLLGHNDLTWEVTYLGRNGVEYAPTLASEGVIVRKRGLRGKRSLVFLNHQASQTERVFFEATEQRAILTALVEAGYIVVISRQWDANALENSWGNDSALDANAELYDYVVAHYPVDTARVAMVGFSMGGISTALAFPDGRIPLKGAACFDCALDLAHLYANGFSSGINAAYQISGGNPYATATSGHDPRLLGAHASFSGKRLAFFRNTDDVIVNPTENTGDFQAQVASVATEETITSYTTGGGHLANIAASKTLLMEFLARCFA